MFDKFWTAFSGEFADKWPTYLLSPAGIFFAVGLAAWISQHGWMELETRVQFITLGQTLVIFVGAILLLMITKVIGTRLADLLLRWLAGEWPYFLHLIRLRLVRRQMAKYRKVRERWSELATQLQAGKLHDVTEYIALDTQLSRDFPVNEKKQMPTRLGNILRAAEEYSLHRYGLDINVIWPRIWLLLPEQTQKELIFTRQQISAQTEVLLWGSLIMIWAIWAWWPIFIGLAAIMFSYRNLIEIARTYGDLLRATFDLYHMQLYEALHWQLPSTPHEEAAIGNAMTRYLRKGYITSNFEYIFRAKA